MLDPSVTFLNHGSFGACPRPVFEALVHWQREVELNPCELLGRRSAALLAEARARLAAFIGASMEHLIFVPNATTAVNTVASSFPLGPGDEVLSTDHEYGACAETWRRICAARGATYREVPIPVPFDRETFAERMLAAAGPRTKLVFVSHITSPTALIFPVVELCRRVRERGIATFVDGAHAPGHIPLDVSEVNADFYTGNCHKWLCAPKGSAFLHVRPEHHALLQAPVMSWGYVAEGSTAPMAVDGYTGTTILERRLQWQGTRDIAAWLSVPAAIDFQAQHDWPAVQRRCHAIARDALHRLSSRFGLSPLSGDDDYAQMVAIPVPHTDAESLRRRLYDESRIEIPVTQHDGRTFMRLSVQAYNDAADIDRLIDAPAIRDLGPAR